MVMVVMDLDGILTRGVAQDPAGALDEQSVKRDRGGQEQGVQRWRVEPLSNERCGTDDEYAVAGLSVSETINCRAAGDSTHTALQNYRVVAAFGQHGGQGIDVGDSPGEDEAVAASGLGLADVFNDLGVAVAVGDKSAMCLSDGARRGDIESVVAECGFVDLQQHDEGRPAPSACQ